MKLKICSAFLYGNTVLNPGDSIDVPEGTAKSWIDAGHAVEDDAVAIVQADAATHSTEPQRDDVAELRAQHTVEQLREMYEAATGKKASRKMHEADLARAIVEAKRGN